MCEFCRRPKAIQLHRKENIGVTSDPFIALCSDGAGIFFENANGDPAYIDINFCPMCGQKLDVREICADVFGSIGEA